MKIWIILGGIFLFSLLLRLWNLNAVGRTWDEFAYVDTGYKLADLVTQRNVSDSLWYTFPDHPPLAKILYGGAAHFDVSGKDKGTIIYNYDWTHARLLSALFSSLSVVLVTLFGIEFFSPFVGIMAGVILAMMPIFLGLSQLVTLESIIMFFFSASVYSYIKMFDSKNNKWIVYSGLLTGCALDVKYSNILLIPLLLALTVLFLMQHRKGKSNQNLFVKIVGIICLSFLTFFLLWPGLWTHSQDIIQRIISFRFEDPSGGNSHRSNDILYFFTYFLITTPILILLSLIVGIKHSIQKKSYLYGVLLMWFSIPFLQSFYSLKLNGIRYIIEIYAPMSLLAAIGIETIISRFTKDTAVKFAYSIPLIIYLFISLLQITPYYLSFYNSFVGGPYGVSQNKSFTLGWWGEGQPEAAKYLVQNGHQGMNVALAEIPEFVMPPIDGINFYLYKPNVSFDYIVMNNLYLHQHDFQIDTYITQQYSVVYTVNAHGGPFIFIYKHIQ